MTLLPGDIALIHFGTPWGLVGLPIRMFQLVLYVYKNGLPSFSELKRMLWEDPYHVEMVWDVTKRGYKALTMQPPVLAVVERNPADLKMIVYRLKYQLDDLQDIFWIYFNEKIGHEFYGPDGACGWIVRNFYRDEFNIKMPLYPASIKKFCKKSNKFVRII